MTAAVRVRRLGRRGPIPAILGALLTLTGLFVMVAAAAESGSAGADTAPYELYCPNTPVGSIALNDVVTTGTLTPAPGSTGSTFVLTNYQTSVPLPASLATAAAALQSDIMGNASTAVDAVGATPANIQEGPFDFDVPIPNPVPADGLTLAIPSAPATVGPFTATGDTITLSEDSSASLTLEVSNTALALSCTAYPNNDVATGIVPTDPYGNPIGPTGDPISPVIASEGTTGTTTTTTVGSTTTTTGAGGQNLTGPYELYCPGTPIGSVALNDVVTQASVEPAAPAIGQSFSVSGYQTDVPIPAAIASAAAALGDADVTGTAQTTVEAFGASPVAITSPLMSFDEPIPNPVPPSGVTLLVPTSAGSIGPFTAAASAITIEGGTTVRLTLDVAGSTLSLNCTSYANDSVPSGIVTGQPAGSPIDPVIATATGTGSGGGPSGVSAPYELYCPHTPVGDLDFNDVTSTGTFSSSSLAAGDQFQVNGYQISIPVPEGVAAAALGLSNTAFAGLATSAVDAYGASPAREPTGSLAFEVAIPDPVPSNGLVLNLPSQATTVGPFTADGGPIAIAQDQTVLVVAKLSGKAFTMNCTAYANDSIASSGSTTSPPPTEPIRPLITSATASGTPTTTPPPHPPNPGPGSPYELYCQGSPIGDLAINDVVTTATISPATLNEGDTFAITNLQTTFTLPQAVAQEMENLGLTSLSGDLSTFFDVSGIEYGYPYYDGYSSSSSTSVTLGGSSGGVSIGIPYPPYPGFGDMPFDITLPSPVPAGGVPVTATGQGNYLGGTFAAAGGPITVSLVGADMAVSAFGNQFGVFCESLANDSVPTGISSVDPVQDTVEPVIATATATNIPPPPGPPGAYELYCPGTPVGTIVLNNVSTTGTITPADPSAGSQFDLTGYQNEVTIPAAIVSAAAALGNVDIVGSATASLDATGATPATLPTPDFTFDVPIPSPVPSTGLTLSIPATAASIGPFTASGGPITIEQAGRISLTLTVTGNNLTLSCDAYANDSLPSGIDSGGIPPAGGPISPQIASTEGTAPTTAPGSSATTTPPATQTTTATTTPVTTDPAPQSADPTTTDPSPTTGSGGTGSGSGGSGSGGGSSSSSGASGEVTASSSSLAFTGSGPGVRIMALVGAAAVLLGLALLVAVEEPRKLLRHLLRRSDSY